MATVTRTFLLTAPAAGSRVLRDHAFTDAAGPSRARGFGRLVRRLLNRRAMKYLALVGLAAAACSGGDGRDDEFVAAAESMEGIYQVQSFTRNDTACAPGGASILGSDRFAIAAKREILGRPFLDLISCASPSDCRDKLAAERAGEGFQIEFLFTLAALGDDGELTGEGASTGFGDGEVCREAELSDSLLTLAGSELRLEHAIVVADEFPVDSDGFCTTIAAAQAAAGKPCSQMEVLTATFLEPL